MRKDLSGSISCDSDPLLLLVTLGSNYLGTGTFTMIDAPSHKEFGDKGNQVVL